MIPISKQKIDHTISQYKKEIQEHLKTVRTSIQDWLSYDCLCDNKKNEYPCLDEDQRRYLYLLKCQISNIVFCDMDQIDRYKNAFDSIISEEQKKSDTFKLFKDKLLNIMGYEKLRSDKNKMIYPQFFKKLGIKACVYCNSQLTITTELDDEIYVARFQVDHYIDKASYPCFSISFYNLYPVCASCNNKKGNKSLGFKLYSNVNDELIKFSLDSESIAMFRIYKNDSLLKINFSDNDSGLDRLFAIQKIYETQKDLAAEIIIKSEIYNDTYKKTLKKSFSKLYGRGSASINFNRIILGNYTEPKDIHKRPMSKFTQDIAKQLGLI